MPCGSLPEDLWKLILQLVPVRERLGACATVSKTLHRAAAAATDHLDVCLSRFSNDQMECFWRWLNHHGQHLITLVITGTDSFAQPVLSQLPCQNLCQLQLSRCRVQLGPSSSQPGVLQVCTALTQLVLCRCILVGGRTSLTALSAVPALQHLELQHLRHAVLHLRDEVPHDTDCELPAAVLNCLQQLTLLNVTTPNSRVKVRLQHLSCLRSLQQLHLEGTQAISPSTTPGLDQLTVLQALELNNLTLDPTTLHGCTTLQRLGVACIIFMTGTHGMQSLLDLIAQQQQLRHLEISLFVRDWARVPSAFTALSASSKLQHLHLSVCYLPAAAWQQGVFRPGQQLPELQSFAFKLVPGAVAPTGFGQQDVAAFVSCCPALRDVDILIQLRVQLTALARLTALEELTVSRADATSVSSLSALSDLRNLHSLEVSGDSHQFDAAGLLRLTSLRRLTSMVAVYLGFPTMRMTNTGPASDPDVWKQLLQKCQMQQELQEQGQEQEQE